MVSKYWLRPEYVVRTLPPMRFLIQRIHSAQFFHHGEWLSNRRLAQRFADIETIQQACLEYGLKTVQLVVTFEDDRPDVSFQLEHQ